MSETVIVAIIAAVASVISSIIALVGAIANKKSNSKVEKSNAEMEVNIAHKLEVSQAVTDTKIEELTREVREHNNFAHRMPVVEQAVVDIKADISHLKKYHEEKYN